MATKGVREALYPRRCQDVQEPTVPERTHSSMTFHSWWPEIPVGPRHSGRFDLQYLCITSSFGLSGVVLQGSPPQCWMRGLPASDRDVENSQRLIQRAECSIHIVQITVGLYWVSGCLGDRLHRVHTSPYECPPAFKGAVRTAVGCVGPLLKARSFITLQTRQTVGR